MKQPEHQPIVPTQAENSTREQGPVRYPSLQPLLEGQDTPAEPDLRELLTPRQPEQPGEAQEKHVHGTDVWKGFFRRSPRG